MRLPRPTRRGVLPRPRLSITVCAAACGAILVAWWILVAGPGHQTLTLHVTGRELVLLAPRFLALLALLPLVWLARSFTLADLAPAQTALSAACRSLLILSIVLALARPAATSTGARVSAVFLVDVSDSVADDQVEAARRFVDAARAAAHAQGGEAHLVTFARRPRVVALPPGDAPLPAIARHGAEAGGATDIAAAMELGHALFAPATLRRMVLLSDGRETEGSAVAEAYRAREAGVRIDHAPLPSRARPEVLVRALALPPRIAVGRPFEVVAEVVSDRDGPATLSLTQDDLPNPLEPRRRVELRAGANDVRFRSLVRAPGHVTYRVALDARSPDTFAANNAQVAAAHVAGRPRVLVCEGEPERAGPLREALERESIDVEVRGPQGIPTVLRELERYDLVVLSDVAPLYVGPAELAALESYVRDLGGGLLFAAGPTSFGAGGLAGSGLERLLPLRFDAERKRDQPVLALALVIDKSGSMAGQKIELAKEAARATAE
ncbi:MAG: VWA domain-containing protein, partial [Myxococcota bacterium]